MVFCRNETGTENEKGAFLLWKIFVRSVASVCDRESRFGNGEPEMWIRTLDEAQIKKRTALLLKISGLSVNDTK